MKKIATVLAAAGLALAVGGAAGAAELTKMTIATGVDPAFSQFYVAKESGIFEKNGLDVSVNTGPSGSAMVAFLIGNQVHAAYGSENSGVLNNQVDDRVVTVGEGTFLKRWLSVVANDQIKTIEDLKGKRVGVAQATGSETFWLSVLKNLNLKAEDYEVVNVEAPEMVAALERGNIDAFSVWEPWPTRAVMSVDGAKILLDNEGFLNLRNLVFMNRDWIEENPETAEAFMRSMVEATELINDDREAATQMVANFLRMPLDLATELMPKLDFNMDLSDGTMENIATVEEQLKRIGKLQKDLDWEKFVYPDLLKKVAPERVTYTSIPPKM